MIDTTQEKPISLTEAARQIPAVDGRKPHPSTIYRWARRGIGGTRLEIVRLGHRVCTSAEALSRFFNELGQADVEQRERATPRERTTRQREADRARAQVALKRAGIIEE